MAFRTYVFNYKIVILGEVEAGKSALFARITEDTFSEDYSETNLCNCQVHDVDVAGKMGFLNLWDTSGDTWMPGYRISLRKLHKEARGFVLVYDTTSLSSFSNLDYWLKEIRDFGPKDAYVMLVGTKSDLEEGREVDREKAARYAEQHGLTFTEASAKSGKNVKQLFDTLAEDILKRSELELLPPPEKRSKKADPSVCLPAEQEKANTEQKEEKEKKDGNVPASFSE